MRAVILGIALVAMGCSAPAGPGTVEGTVKWDGRGVATALVQAYPRPDLDPAVAPLAEAASDGAGRFRLELPAGTYWIWARATAERDGRPVRLRGEASPSPVRVQAGRTARADVVLTDPSALGASGVGSGIPVEGIVRGAPFAEVMVYAYPGRHRRPTGPGFAAAAAPDTAGRYRLGLRPGTYTLAARWRRSGEPHGSLVPGDKVAETVVQVPSRGTVQAPPLALRPLDPSIWGQTLRASPKGDTWVEGTVVDPGGRPAEGLYVLAFTDPRMVGKPAAMAPPTGPSGEFRIYLPGPGTYWLGARSRIGGPAEPGERVGAFRGDDGNGVRVAPGAPLRGVRIVVEEIW